MNSKIRTTWDLGLLYKSEKDPRIERDMKAIEEAYARFEKKYRGKPFTKTPQALARALVDYDALYNITNGVKPVWYFSLRKSLNSKDSVASAKEVLYTERNTVAYNRITFFSLEIGKISLKQQKVFLKHPALAQYRYKLECIFAKAKHRLSEGEEQLESLLADTSYSRWVSGNQKIISSITIPWKGKNIPLSKAGHMIPDLPQKERYAMDELVGEALRNNSDFAEAEINAVYSYKKIMDDREGYRAPHEQIALNHHIDPATLDRVVSSVTERFDISQRFYKLHGKLLGIPKMKISDRSVPIGNIKGRFDFERSIKIVGDAFASIDPQYKAILDSFVENGQIDVAPRKGKYGGAYCWGNQKPYTYILLNHVDTFHSLQTFAHEMGHAMHTELSKRQPKKYEAYTTATAEVASTFFEQVTNEILGKELKGKERIVWLHGKILNDAQTIFRQIACFNFEKELHTTIRAEGYVQKDVIAELLAKHLGSYLGPYVDLGKNRGYGFVSWPHIRNFFYVYSYAFGQLVSRAMVEEWKKDPAFAQKLERFLGAGGSKCVEDIFADAGIDVRSPKFFKKGLEAIERDIDELERLTSIKPQKRKK